MAIIEPLAQVLLVPVVIVGGGAESQSLEAGEVDYLHTTQSGTEDSEEKDPHS